MRTKRRHQRRRQTLLVMGIVSVWAALGWAQEVYKWVDEKGVVHYGDRPMQPEAAPLDREKVPFSSTGSLPPDTETTTKVQSGSRRKGTKSQGRTARPKPTLVKPKVWLDTARDLQLTTTMRNSGKAVCWFPALEVEIFDENGDRDGNFETILGRELPPGDETRVEAKYLTPVGNELSWRATPRCGEKPNVLYGADKRGNLKITHHRTLRMRRR